MLNSEKLPIGPTISKPGPMLLKHAVTAEKLVGVETDEPLRDIHDFVRCIRQRRGIRPIVPEGRFEVNLDEIPELPTFWLDEAEQPVPTGKRWLFESNV